MAVNNSTITHKTTEFHAEMLLEPTHPERKIPLYHVGQDGCWEVAFYLTRMPMDEEGISASIVRMPDGSTPEKSTLIVCGTCGRVVEADHKRKILVGLSYTPYIDSPEAVQHLMTAAIREHVRLHHDHA